MNHWESSFVATVLAVFDLLVSVIASGHVLLYKRDTRAAIGWIGLIWLSPLLGSALYLLLGINRIHRKVRMRKRSRHHVPHAHPDASPATILRTSFGAEGSHLSALSHLVNQIVRFPLEGGNRLEPLIGGDEAYPAMLGAIDGATHSVALSTYIFDDDRAGKPFIEALARAVGRGVEVRVLVDGFGARHRWPSVVGSLRRAGIPVAKFLPSMVPSWFPYLNLRNHRKLLIVDEREAFTGGLNILEDYLLGIHPSSPKHDFHVRVRGPAVAHLWHVFVEDWEFATGETLRDRPSYAIEPDGVLARVVVDGPDDDLDTILKVILGALACAKSSVQIVTPYFLPDSRLVSALETAALRGVKVDILLPSRTNHILVQWASIETIREVVAGHCRVWAADPPFDHTKMMVVDGAWSFIGSANWDPRSLRLNFELNVECYDEAFAGRLEAIFRDKMRNAKPITLKQIDERNLALKLRDGAARLLSPYL